MPLASDLNFKRVLVTRIDRIGDVVLSTPVFEAIKTAYPKCFLGVLVVKETEPVVSGNPWVDEVIVYDKKGRDRSWWRIFFLGLKLNKKKFDLVIHLHPTNRVYFLTWIARIPIRIGYRRRNFYFLTHPFEERKWQGKKHEAQYNFDLLSSINIAEPEELKFYFPLKDAARKELTGILPSHFDHDRYVVFHPSASCVSKRWAPERLARVADQLKKNYGIFPVLIGEGEGVSHAAQMQELMTETSLNLAGELTLGMLGWLLKGARLLISNDSGPVHIACAVKTPVISIFGRNQAGLSVTRWRPLSPNSSYLQKDVGCVDCLAHNCVIDFKCLKELQVEDVLMEAEKYESVLV